MHPAMMMVRYHQCTLQAVLVILLGACTHYQSSQSINVACQAASFSQRIALLTIPKSRFMPSVACTVPCLVGMLRIGLLPD